MPCKSSRRNLSETAWKSQPTAACLCAYIEGRQELIGAVQLGEDLLDLGLRADVPHRVALPDAEVALHGCAVSAPEGVAQRRTWQTAAHVAGRLHVASAGAQHTAADSSAISRQLL